MLPLGGGRGELKEKKKKENQTHKQVYEDFTGVVLEPA